MALDLLSHFRMLGRYNRLANERLYRACAKLGNSERTKDQGAFFGSIHGTLNHILVGDRIWMTRFEGGEAPSTNLLDEVPVSIGSAIQGLASQLPGHFGDGGKPVSYSFVTLFDISRPLATSGVHSTS